ncbi:MAG: Solitary outer membrane autotransporter beta-barrel domain [Puniceicoccales bacterium]|jgi:hypothetical protein|nr:Solitary outer membrane autotransporter beta-barrel domain [Puniceicoccales bacterium]
MNFQQLALVSAAALLAAPALQAQLADYKTVMADEFVRSYMTTCMFSQPSGLTGGTFTSPSSLTGHGLSQLYVNGSGEYSLGRDFWDIGDFEPYVRAVLGGSGYDEKVPAPGAGFADDRTDGFSIAFNGFGGIRWYPWRHTVINVMVGYGYMYLENNYSYNNPVSQALAPSMNGSTRNWYANVLNSVTQVGASQSIPLWSGAWDDPEDSPTLPRLRFFTNYTSTTHIGVWGTKNDQQRYVTAYIWTNGAELFLPVGRPWGKQLFLTPYFQRTDMFDDGHHSLSTTRHFYEAGVRAGIFNDATWGGNNVFFLSGSALWGSHFNGWQVSAGLRF